MTSIPLIFQRPRQRIYRNRARIRAILGDGNSNVYAGKSHYWVRQPAQTDANGVVTYGEALKIRYAGASALPEIDGLDVLLFYDHDNVLSIERVDAGWFTRNDIDSRAINSASPYDRFVLLHNVVREMTRPVGSSSGEDSTLITIRENPFKINDYLDWAIYGGTPRAADKPDLASYIPVADLQRLVIVWFDELTQEPKITASTPQALTTAIDSTDYDECFAQLPHNEYKPLLAVNLADAQTSIDANNVVEDLRQFVNTPRIYGFPNPIVSGQAIYIRDTQQQLVFGALTVIGTLTVEGRMKVL